jgi:GTP pyrophosphokinase
MGAGDVSIEQVVRFARQQLPAETEKSFQRRTVQAVRYKKSPFYIYGVGNLLTRVARCCNPVPGEDISGYITAGRGVTIHRQDCGSLLRLKSQEPERIIQVHWGGEPLEVYAVPIRVRAFDRPGLLRDITATIDRLGLSIEALVSEEIKDGKTDTKVTVAIPNLDALQLLLSRLRQIANVIEASRASE